MLTKRYNLIAAKPAQKITEAPIPGLPFYVSDH
ncbi:hypothetical protein BH23BAC3_BH23BAC3_16380 [soil metagenome]